LHTSFNYAYVILSALQSRRAAMGMLAGVAALAAGAAPSQAAYGDAANVFGKITNKSGEQQLLYRCIHELPSRWTVNFAVLGPACV
jgi:hypothetical protein